MKFFTTPNTLGASVTERMCITEAGNITVGQGVTALSRVHVRQQGTVDIRVENSNSTADAFFNAQNTVGNAYFGVDATGAFMEGALSLPLVFYTAATERIRVTALGGVSFGSSGTGYGTSGQVLTSAGNAPPTWTTVAAGTVTSASVVSANGFAGTVATATSTPAITLTTTITGLLKGNGTAISAATVRTDYAEPTTGLATGLLKNTVTTGAHTIATVRTDYAEPTTALATGLLKNTTTTGAHTIAVAGTDYSAGTSALVTGILKSTTTTGALTIAVAADFPTLNQNTTGTASNVTGTVVATTGGTGQTVYAVGDVLYASTTTALSKLTVGTAGQALVSTGTLPAWTTLALDNMPGAWVKKAVRAATTAAITLSAPQTVDGVVLVAGDRVLVKNQASTPTNGIYVVAAGAWTRALDADTIGEIAGATVSVDEGTANAGKIFNAPISSTATLGTTVMPWYEIVDSAAVAVAATKTLTVNNSITLAGTDATTITLPATTGTVALNNQTMFIGTTSVAINRTTANLALTGISSVAFPGATSGTATLQATAVAGTPTISLPATTGTLALSDQAFFLGTTSVAINRASATLNVAGIGTLAASGAVTMSAAVASTTTATGTLIVTGGVGVSGQVTAGTLYSNGDVTAFSDARIKTNVEVIPNALDKVCRIRGVTYTRTDNGDLERGKRSTGVIAQEVEAVLPEAVVRDAIDPENGTMGVNYGNLAGLLIEAIKELRQENLELKARLAMLEAKEQA
jgi:hypothetical protein